MRGLQPRRFVRHTTLATTCCRGWSRHTSLTRNELTGIGPRGTPSGNFGNVRNLRRSFKRHVARVCPASDFGAAGGQPDIQGTKQPNVVPDSRNHAPGLKASFVKRTGTMRQGQAGRTRSGSTRHDKNNHTQHKRRWTTFQDFFSGQGCGRHSRARRK